MTMIYGAGEVDATLPTFLEELARRPARVIPIPATNAGKSLLSRPCFLVGFSLRESGGVAVATCEIVNGATSNGEQAVEIALAAGGFDTESIQVPGLYCDNGLYLNVLAGSVVGAVWARF